jgi:hypothetical protein
MTTTFLTRLVFGIPLRTLALTTLVSYIALALATLQGWPLWAVTLAALTPWAPLFALATQRTARLDAWLALFLVLAVSQTGHLFEHAAQMVQIHVLGLTGKQASGVFGALNIEWVHLIWNAWVLLAVVALLAHYRHNGWLRLAVLLAAWHMIEHVYIMSVFMRTGTAGTPGLLADGGAIVGGLPLNRPDLHFLYNLAETAPLLIAFFVEARRALIGRSTTLSEVGGLGRGRRRP